MEEILIESLKINGNDVDSDTKKLSITTPLNYEECLRLILDIGAQIELLKERNIGILSVQKDNVLKMQNGGYIIDSNILSFNCDENGIVKIDKPFKYKNGMAEELKDISELPTTVSYDVAYFSLVQLTLELMELNTLNQLEPTKLYYLLERCLKQRKFIFI